MPELISALLIERDAKALLAHRRRAPFAGQWVLPLVVVRDDEAAEEALRRHAREQFDAAVGEEAFVETVYMTDPDDQRQYVANIFRTPIDGAMRFNAEGDYDDARWLGAGDLDALWMPPDLRVPLIKILSEPSAGTGTDWAAAYAASGEGTPLGDTPAPPIEAGPPPDNRTSWDAISAAYQEERYGDRFGDQFMWSWTLPEDDLQLLNDVSGKHVLVLGCGGGQDVVALTKMGAIAIGIDQSAKQIAYGRKYAARRDAPNASFVEGTVEDLSRFDDASFDMAVSAHALNYVEHIEDTLRETHRVLRPGGSFTLSVRHPFDAALADEAPYRVEHAYWDDARDWQWTFEGREPASFRQWFWSISRWFEMLADAGFRVDRMLEPREPADAADGGDAARRELVPYTLILKARKP